MVTLSLQILVPSLLNHNVKSRLRAKPPCSRRSNTLVRKRRIFILNLQRLNTLAASSGIRH